MGRECWAYPLSSLWLEGRLTWTRPETGNGDAREGWEKHEWQWRAHARANDGLLTDSVAVAAASVHLKMTS